MADLIPILSRPIGDQINSVDARDLHVALESRADFSTWIRERVAQCDLVKSKDFEVSTQRWKSPVGALVLSGCSRSSRRSTSR